MESFEKNRLRHSRILIHSLIISGTLNIALIATFAVFALKEKKKTTLPTFTEKRPLRVTLSNKEVLESFYAMPYEELACNLFDETHIEEGQRRCDLALSYLAAYHHFDVERALSGFPIEKTVLKFKEKEIALFPALTNEMLSAIRTFAKTEVWPLTPEGLFYQMQHRPTLPQSLIDAFKNSGEYFALQKAFKRLPYTISEEAIFSLVLASTWEDIHSFSEELRASPTGKPQSFAPFLTPLLEKKSPLAASLLVLLEKEYALKQLNNDQMHILLSLLTDRTPEIDAFIDEVKGGIRPNALKDLAENPTKHLPRTHTVQSGDSLWKLSRHYGVDVERIKELNNLESETLQVGNTLQLPP